VKKDDSHLSNKSNEGISEEEGEDEVEEMFDGDYTVMLGDLTYEQVQEKKVTKKRMFYELWLPDNTYKQVWDILGFFFIFYQSIVVPFRISFSS